MISKQSEVRDQKSDYRSLGHQLVGPPDRPGRCAGVVGEVDGDLGVRPAPLTAITAPAETFMLHNLSRLKRQALGHWTGWDQPGGLRRTRPLSRSPRSANNADPPDCGTRRLMSSSRVRASASCGMKVSLSGLGRSLCARVRDRRLSVLRRR